MNVEAVGRRPGGGIGGDEDALQRQVDSGDLPRLGGQDEVVGPEVEGNLKAARSHRSHCRHENDVEALNEVSDGASSGGLGSITPTILRLHLTQRPEIRTG